MKKLLTLLLTLCMLIAVGVTFTACGDDGSVNEEKWEQMLAPQSFENYTVVQSGTITTLYEGGSQTFVQHATVKITNGKVHVLCYADSSIAVNEVFTDVAATAQKSNYEQVFLAVLDKFENFTYDANEKVYKNPETVTVSISNVEYTGTITMTNGKVTIDENGKLANFVCDYVQTTTVLVEGIPMTTTASGTNFSFTFSNYGTTVV